MKIKYEKCKCGYKITRVIGTGSAVVLPSRRFGRMIVEIGENALAGEDCEVVQLPKFLLVLGAGAFRDCRRLEFVGAPGCLSFVGDEAFANCESLESIDWQHCCLQSIGAHAFKQCSSLDSVKLPNTVSMIGAGAFQDCKSLVSFKNPVRNSVIEAKTFAGCESLKSIDGIDGAVVSDSAFEGTVLEREDD